MDSLFRDFTDAGTEPLAKHGKRREINLCVAVGISVMFFQLEVALIVDRFSFRCSAASSPL